MPPASPPETTAKATKKSYLPHVFLFAFGFLLYSYTISFDYALDDKLYITANSFTQKGLDGIGEIWTNDLMTGFFGTKKNLVEGGRYRPLALTTHAIEYEFFKEAPAIGHFVNVLLYALCGVLLFEVLSRIFPPSARKHWALSIAFLTTALYLAHPLHVEVTANIKSRDEIMSLLFALAAFYFALKYLQENRDAKQLVFAGASFLMALFSKESAVTFLGVVPLTLIFFPIGHEKGNAIKNGALAISPLIAATLVYLGVRFSLLDGALSSMDVAQELMNKPYLLATASEHYASIFFTMGLYLKLLLFPHPLTHDYYPFHPFATYAEIVEGGDKYVDWSNPWAILSLVVYAALLVYGLYALTIAITKGKGDIVGYGILLYLGTFILFSNLFFDIGSFMNDRFMFIPSLGFCLVLAYAGHKMFKGKTTALAFLMGAIILAYSAKTIARSEAWKSDYHLAMADVGTSDGSAKVKMTAGSELLTLAKKTTNPNERAELLKQAETYCLQSLQIYPTYYPPLDILGNIYYEMGNYEYSVHYFVQCLKMKRESRILTNLEAVANKASQEGQFQIALTGYSHLVPYLRGNDLSRVYSSMGEVYGKNLGNTSKSLEFLLKAIESDPTNSGAYQKAGIVYAMMGDSGKAMSHFQKALELDPKNARVMLNMGILYKQTGQPELGEQFMQQAFQSDPTLKEGAGG